MTKKTLQLIATVALAAGFGFTTVTANADDTATTPDPTTTHATVGLTAANGGGAGSIKLVAAPDIQFGDANATDKKSATITGAKQSIKALSFTTVAAKDNPLENLDSSDIAVVNAGSEDPWTVTVQAADFVKDGDTSTKLLGAKIHFDGNAVTQNNPIEGTNLGDATVKPAEANNATVTAGNAGETILSATAGNGIGTWMNRLTTDTNLEIAGGNVAGSYTSELTWTIGDTPSTQA